MMWGFKPTEEYARRFKRWQKDNPRELAAVLDNLDLYLRTLQEGGKPEQVRFGFMHPEKNGVWAIDQKGGGVNLKQSRLYILVEKAKQTVHVLTLGDKRSQKADLLGAVSGWRFIDLKRGTSD